jgi:ketosteroid isomerase-like protein
MSWLYAWAVRRMLQHNLSRLRAGDYRPLMRFYAKDVRFRFPGRSSWAGELHGKDELERWLRRFVDVGLQIFADEIVVSGPPWRMAICIRGTDHLDGPDGELLYENRYVIWAHGSWGLLRDYEVYEDTEKATALDARLESRAASVR